MLAVSYEVWAALEITSLVLMLLCAIFVIFVIIVQPSGQSGLGALGGTNETFYGKNKNKSFESKMKKLTYICLGIIAVFSIMFYLLQLIPVA